MWRKYNITLTDGTSMEIVSQGDIGEYPNTESISVVDLGDELDNTPLIVSPKHIKNLAIDTKTSELLARGFIFDGEIFSLSLAAQSNWIGLQLSIAQGFLNENSFPFKISTIDNKEYSLSWANRNAFFGGVLSTITSILAAGRALKIQVNNATTVSGVDAIVDSRQ